MPSSSHARIALTAIDAGDRASQAAIRTALSDLDLPLQISLPDGSSVTVTASAIIGGAGGLEATTPSSVRARLQVALESAQAALEQAKAAAGNRDIRLGGGVSTIRQFLSAGLIEELHLAIRPILLGTGEHLLHDIDARALGYGCWKSVAGERATHVFLKRG